MRLNLIDITTTLLCLVSMLLTGLFALNFATNNIASETSYVESSDYSSAALLLIIGFTIDLSKYLFWQYRAEKKSYILVSMGLVFFSWAASVSYFITQEASQLEAKRQTTSEYQAYHINIERLQLAIEQKSALMKKRLASRYHKQWDKGEQLMTVIDVLNTDLQRLTVKAHTVGLNAAQTQVSTTAFFLQLSQLLHTSHTVVTSVAYGLLALLIEVCALGTLSLSQHIHQRPQITIDSKKTTKALPVASQEKIVSGQQIKNQKKLTLDERKQRLRADIIQGQITPGFTDIKRGKYGLSQVAIKTVLTELYQEGHLDKAKRGYRRVKN